MQRALNVGMGRIAIKKMLATKAKEEFEKNQVKLIDFKLKQEAPASIGGGTFKKVEEMNDPIAPSRAIIYSCIVGTIIWFSAIWLILRATEE